MILLFHKNNKVVQVYDYDNNLELEVNSISIQDSLISIAKKNTLSTIGWCNINCKNQLNLSEWSKILTHPLKMVSFECATNYYLPSSIGFVEQTPFVKVNKKVEYPTWLMSSDVGALHASVLLKFTRLLNYTVPFDLFLNALAKIGMKEGLLCYSNPKLLTPNFRRINIKKPKASLLNIYWFIKSNYRWPWIFLFLFNRIIYKKKVDVFTFLAVLFKKKIHCKVNFKDVKFPVEENYPKPSIDVLIPTLGREKFLKNVLLDLSKQTLLPNNIIIIEQNSDVSSKSKLAYLSDNWPFKIYHVFTHQLGACNARNIGLNMVKSDWVFFADDDIRLKKTILESAFLYINKFKVNAISLSCLQKNEKEKNEVVFQSTTFGSGTSLVKSEALKNLKFNIAYEFGYGEDADFGMQLRNQGTDILYIPFVSMLHLKAPIGGFRKKIKKEWDLQITKPKPSPTIMIYKLKHTTKEQLQGYKINLILKYFRVQKNKNIFSYYKQMKIAWNKSLYWANYLINKNFNEF